MNNPAESERIKPVSKKIPSKKSGPEITHIKDLVPDKMNARRHTARNIGTIEESLHAVGAGRSIVIDEGNNILAGNGLVEAAANAGITKLQVVEADGNTVIAVRRTGLTDKQKVLLALADNRTATLAEWDADNLTDLLKTLDADDLQKLALTEQDLKMMDIEVPEAETVDAPVDLNRASELQKVWQTAVGQTWQLGQHRLHCGDCREIVPTLGKFDLLLTDPPYGTRVESDGYGRRQNNRATNGKVGVQIEGDEDLTVFSEILELVNPNLLFAFSSPKKSFEMLSVIIGNGLSIMAELVWDKNIPGLGGGIRYQHENIYIAAHSKFDGSGQLFSVMRETSVSRGGDHPHEKPVELMKSLISYSGDIQTILDPFSGVGTILIAAENLNRKSTNIELEPNFVAVCLQRFKDAFPGQEIKLLSESDKPAEPAQ